MPTHCPDPLCRLEDIIKKVCSVELKPIVGQLCISFPTYTTNRVVLINIMFADGVFFHGFRHAELNDARKKMYFRHFKGSRTQFENFENAWEVKMIIKSYQMGPKICKMMRFSIMASEFKSDNI